MFEQVWKINYPSERERERERREKRENKLVYKRLYMIQSSNWM
jgi:hypothetical protein